MSGVIDAAAYVQTIAIVLAIVVGIGAAMLLVGTPVRRRRAARDRRTFDRALAALLDLAGDEDPRTDAIAEVLASTPGRIADGAVVAAGRWLGGSDRARLSQVAQLAGVEARALRALRSRRWGRRLRGVRVLASVSTDLPDRTLFRDRHPEVRAAALLSLRALDDDAVEPTWTAARSPSRTIATAITAGLLDPSSLVRLAAKHAVVSVEPPPVEAVADALGRCKGPDQPRLAALAPLAAVAALGPAASGLDLRTQLDADDARVRAAAIGALASTRPQEFAGRIDAARDEELPVRIAVAKAADRSLASLHVLVELAADPAWQVRQAARATLGRTGAVGRALLRRVQWGAT